MGTRQAGSSTTQEGARLQSLRPSRSFKVIDFDTERKPAVTTSYSQIIIIITVTSYLARFPRSYRAVDLLVKFSLSTDGRLSLTHLFSVISANIILNH